MAQQMICLIGANPLAPEMTLTSGYMHDNKAKTAKMAPIGRRQARMISGIAAFLIIYEVEKRRKRKRRWWFGRGHNQLLSILLPFRHNASS